MIIQNMVLAHVEIELLNSRDIDNLKKDNLTKDKARKNWAYQYHLH
jgi:hypothetical protein